MGDVEDKIQSRQANLESSSDPHNLNLGLRTMDSVRDILGSGWNSVRVEPINEKIMQEEEACEAADVVDISKIKPCSELPEIKISKGGDAVKFIED